MSLVRRFMWKNIISITCLSLLFLAASPICAEGNLPKDDIAFAEKTPINKEGLAKFRALMEETKTRAAIILYKGRTVAEWYWKGEGENSVFEVWSVSKSFASACIGLLIDEGKIASIDDPVHKYIPEWKKGKKADVTLAHLLEQSSGLKERSGFLQAKDQLQAALDADIVTSPGEKCLYNNAACNVLSGVITAASGQDPEAYMREKVWKPIGMDRTYWRRDRAGKVITYAGVQTTARELSRFGQMFLSKGKWQGKRILSERWVEQATTARRRIHVGPLKLGQYGLLWWLDYNQAEGVPHNYSALGLFGNHLTVIPELDLVGVRLVGSDMEGASLMFRPGDWVEALAGVVEREEPTDDRQSEKEEKREEH